MSVEIRIPTANGIKLLTKGKYIEDDISITFNPSILNHDFSIEDGILTRTITSYSNYRITKIGNFGFRDCRTITKLIVPNVTRIEAYGCGSCAGLKEVDFSSLEFIGQQGLANLNIDAITLPSITQIGEQGFYGTTINKLIITQVNSVCALSNANGFSNSSIAKGTGYIYVPDELVDSYKSATNWSTYADQIKGLSELPQDIRERD